MFKFDIYIDTDGIEEEKKASQKPIASKADNENKQQINLFKKKKEVVKETK
jgi:hypothetical protein